MELQELIERIHRWKSRVATEQTDGTLEDYPTSQGDESAELLEVGSAGDLREITDNIDVDELLPISETDDVVIIQKHVSITDTDGLDEEPIGSEESYNEEEQYDEEKETLDTYEPDEVTDEDGEEDEAGDEDDLFDDLKLVDEEEDE